MDRFDLHWPKTDASFLTDGRRCRIVWRTGTGTGTGPGGSIDNNDLCKKRVADSLTLAPDLLGELTSRGYPDLAAEIRALAGGEDERGRVMRWLDGLPGEPAWEETGTRRGKSWIRLGAAEGESLELRPPARRGKAEWVLRRSAPSARKPACVVAPHLKGIFSYLVGRAGESPLALVETALAACAELDHPDAVAARERWEG
jgi:hypothetical protein